jgi:mannose-6-phosphate isomerase-like protein (cupin superfamily)
MFGTKSINSKTNKIREKRRKTEEYEGDGLTIPCGVDHRNRDEGKPGIVSEES